METALETTLDAKTAYQDDMGEPGMDCHDCQFLTFAVKQEKYCVDIMLVREIKAWSEVTRLPNMPEYMRGVINLRGSIIPIFDLHARFNQTLTEVSENHVVIILAVDQWLIGVLVDQVSDILNVDHDDIKPAPDIQHTVDDRFIDGLIATERGILVLLNAERLFREEMLENLETQMP